MRHPHPLIHATALFASLSLVAVGGACRYSPDQAGPNTASAELHPILQGGSWGYMDHNGNVAVEPRFDAAWPFSEGRALVQTGDRFGYIDPAGDVVIEPQFSDAWYFSGGYAPVLVDTNWTFVGLDGNVVEGTSLGITPPASGPSVEHVELDRVRVGSLYGFRNASGQIVIDPRFDQAWHFVDGLARVQVGGKWGFIDRSGRMAIEPAFDVAWDFNNGLARVKVGERFGYLNTDGEYVWEPTS